MKPCPFCGGNRVEVVDTIGFYVRCRELTCQAFGPGGVTPDEARAAWNQRLGTTLTTGQEIDFAHSVLTAWEGVSAPYDPVTVEFVRFVLHKLAEWLK